MQPDLLEVLAKMGSPSVLVVGDLILDRYVWGEAERISPEAPIQVLRVTGEDARIGGAGNVANNLAVLGARVQIAGVVGRDLRGDDLREALAGAAIGITGVVEDPGRPTVTKTRMIARNQQILRVDREQTGPIAGSVEEVLVGWCGAHVGDFDAVVISDYAKGVLTPAVLAALIDGARRKGIRVLVDPKGEDYTRYRGASLVTPNRREAEIATRIPIGDAAGLDRAGRRLIEDLELEAAVITRGKDGMSVFLRAADGTIRRHDSAARGRVVYDVTGAGDTVIAVLALALASGEGLETAADLASAAAAVVVGKVGAVPVSRAEVADEVRLRVPAVEDKVVDLEELRARVTSVRAEGRRIVFTNGCFDLIHVGHVQYLQFARAQGDFLVVGVNSDASVRGLKTEARPIIPEAERLQVLAALSSVDAVVLFDQETPIDLIRFVRPDVLVKGGDYVDKVVVGREEVEGAGGRVVLAPFVGGISTSAILRRMAEAGGD